MLGIDPSAGHATVLGDPLLTTEGVVGVRVFSPAVVFFLLPIFLMAGVALQSAGLYLCLVFIPLIFAQPMARGVSRVTLSTSMLLALCYLVPILTQSIVALNADPLRSCVIDPPRIKSCTLNLMAWLKSPVSGAFIGLALGWCFLSLRKSQTSLVAVLQPSEFKVVNDDEVRFTYFARGFLSATLLFFAYGLVQHFTGFNALSAQKILEDEHRMSNGQYRIFSFFGHPLSLAGASLVWASFALSGLRTSLQKNIKIFTLSWSVWATLAAMQSLNVYMSGGRTALLVVVLLWGLLLFEIVWRFIRNHLLRSWFEKNPRSAAATLVALFVFVASGLVIAAVLLVPQWNPRGMGGGTLGQGPLGDRPLFWHTYLAMWRDSPWFGQGYFAVEHGVRTSYYLREGLGELRDKFNAHNIFLEVLGISGLLGLFSYLTAFVLMFFNFKVLAGHSNERRVLLFGLTIGVVSNLLHGLTQNTFFDSAVTASYLGLIGLLVIPPFKQQDVKKN